MKKLMILLLMCLGGAKLAFSQITPSDTRTPPANEEKIQWMTIEEAAKLCKKKPKKIFIDVYTDWCGWCKKMDLSTFANPVVVKNMNKDYYAVKLNAEGGDAIIFKDTTYIRQPNARTHDFSLVLLNRNMSYPTTVYLDEDLNKIAVLPGYQPPENMEKILKYFAGDNHKKVSWEAYQEGFQSEIK